MPPAFVLSQDQTLQSNYNIFAYEDLFPLDDFDSSIKVIVLFTTTSSVLQPSKSDSGSSHYSIFQGTRRLPSCKIIPSRGKMIFLFFPAIFLQTLTSQQAGFRGNLLYFLKSTSRTSSKGFFRDASLDHSNLFYEHLLLASCRASGAMVFNLSSFRTLSNTFPDFFLVFFWVFLRILPKIPYKDFSQQKSKLRKHSSRLCVYLKKHTSTKDDVEFKLHLYLNFVKP